MVAPGDDREPAEEYVQRTVELFSPSALRAARRRGGYTLHDLADLGGLSAVAIGSWERGQALPTVGSLAAVADSLGVAIEDLLRAGPSEASLRHYRIVRGLTIADAAASAGLSPTSLARAERALNKSINNDVVVALAGVYERTTDEIQAAWQYTRETRLEDLRRRRPASATPRRRQSK